MTVKSVLCVFSGTPEEIDALNASLALAGLDQSTMRVIPMSKRAEAEGGEIVVKTAGQKAENSEEGEYKRSILMADTMIDLLRTKGECRASDLAARGFNLDEIGRYWDMAESLAAVEFSNSKDEEEQAVKDKLVSSLLVA